SWSSLALRFLLAAATGLLPVFSPTTSYSPPPTTIHLSIAASLVKQSSVSFLFTASGTVLFQPSPRYESLIHARLAVSASSFFPPLSPYNRLKELLYSIDEPLFFPSENGHTTT